MLYEEQREIDNRQPHLRSHNFITTSFGFSGKPSPRKIKNTQRKTKYNPLEGKSSKAETCSDKMMQTQLWLTTLNPALLLLMSEDFVEHTELFFRTVAYSSYDVPSETCSDKMMQTKLWLTALNPALLLLSEDFVEHTELFFRTVAYSSYDVPSYVFWSKTSNGYTTG